LDSCEKSLKISIEGIKKPCLQIRRQGKTQIMKLNLSMRDKRSMSYFITLNSFKNNKINSIEWLFQDKYQTKVYYVK